MPPQTKAEFDYSFHRGRAMRLLNHYFQYAWCHDPPRWDSDNTGEVESIVDHLINATIARIQMDKEESVESALLDALGSIKATVARIQMDEESAV